MFIGDDVSSCVGSSLTQLRQMMLRIAAAKALRFLRGVYRVRFLAGELGVSGSSLSRYVAGDSVPRLRHLPRVLRLLDELFEDAAARIVSRYGVVELLRRDGFAEAAALYLCSRVGNVGSVYAFEDACSVVASTYASITGAEFGLVVLGPLIPLKGRCYDEHVEGAVMRVCVTGGTDVGSGLVVAPVFAVGRHVEVAVNVLGKRHSSLMVFKLICGGSAPCVERAR